MNNIVNNKELPMGLSMALAKNSNALDYFSSLTQAQQQQVVDHTHQIGSKKEMQSYVNNLANQSLN